MAQYTAAGNPSGSSFDTTSSLFSTLAIAFVLRAAVREGVGAVDGMSVAMCDAQRRSVSSVQHRTTWILLTSN